MTGFFQGLLKKKRDYVVESLFLIFLHFIVAALKSTVVGFSNYGFCMTHLMVI